MAGQDTTAMPKPLACEISTYTEEQLDRYLEENGRIVSVQDPENISLEFIQRLRDIVHREHGATKSRAVDLDQVAARLEAVPADREQFNRSPSLATTASPPPQEELDREDLQNEKQYYHELVNNGGRPPYPFHLLEDFFWHPDQYLEHKQYRDIVFFWRDRISNKDERTCFCGCHLLRWERFRRLQRIIRERSVKNEWSLVRAANCDNWATSVRCYGPCEGQWGFFEYAERMTRRLNKYGFTRPFQLDRNLDRQDKLTTWIEYLGYEYYFYDQAASFVKRFQRLHDDAWEKLTNANVLGPNDTYEVICNIETAFRDAHERDSAEKAVEFANAAVLSTQKAISNSQVPTESLQKRLLADQSTLRAAQARHTTIVARDNAIIDFLQKIRPYRWEKGEADRYSCLLRWIEQQIPSIEVELSSLGSTESEADRRDSRRGLKRSRSSRPDEAPRSTRCRASSVDNQRPTKRLKTRGQSDVADYSIPDAASSMPSALRPDASMVQELGRSKVTSDESSGRLQCLRRSERIANNMKRIPTIAQGLTPPRSAGGCVKKNRLKKAGQRHVAKPQRVGKKSRSGR